MCILMQDPTTGDLKPSVLFTEPRRDEPNLPIKSWAALTDELRAGIEAVIAPVRFVATDADGEALLNKMFSYGLVHVWPEFGTNRLSASLTNRGRALLHTRDGEATLCPSCEGLGAHHVSYGDGSSYGTHRCTDCNNGIVYTDPERMAQFFRDREEQRVRDLLNKLSWSWTEEDRELLVKHGYDPEDIEHKRASGFEIAQSYTRLNAFYRNRARLIARQGR